MLSVWEASAFPTCLWVYTAALTTATPLPEILTSGLCAPFLFETVKEKGEYICNIVYHPPQGFEWILLCKSGRTAGSSIEHCEVVHGVVVYRRLHSRRCGVQTALAVGI